MLIEEGEPSKEEQELVYDEMGNKEDDSLLFGNSREALVNRKSLLAPKREKKRLELNQYFSYLLHH